MDLSHPPHQWPQSLLRLKALQDMLDLYRTSRYWAELTNVGRFKVLLKTLFSRAGTAEHHVGEKRLHMKEG